jgi:hypothetical protein
MGYSNDAYCYQIISCGVSWIMSGRRTCPWVGYCKVHASVHQLCACGCISGAVGFDTTHCGLQRWPQSKPQQIAARSSYGLGCKGQAKCRQGSLGAALQLAKAPPPKKKQLPSPRFRPWLSRCFMVLRFMQLMLALTRGRQVLGPLHRQCHAWVAAETCPLKTVP